MDLGKSTRRIDAEKGEIKKKLNLYISFRFTYPSQGLFKWAKSRFALTYAIKNKVKKCHILLLISARDKMEWKI